MEICKICGKEYKKVTSMHITTHKDQYPNITMEQYNLMPEYDEFSEDFDVEPTGNTKITQKQIQENIFGKKKDTSRPLQDFLDEFMLTEDEARSVLKKFTKGDRIDPVVQAKNFNKLGAEGAAKVKDQDRVETHSLHVAENLVDNHGFTCTEIIGKKGNTPKTWVLIKQ